jgi:hypothetical protein
MDDTKARELTRRWIEKVPLDPDRDAEEIEQLRHGMLVVLAGLMPRLAEAVVTDGEARWPEVVALGDTLLLRFLRGQETEGGTWIIAAQGYPLEEVRRPSVGERLLFAAGGRVSRRRAWGFGFPDYTLTLVTEEPLDAPEPGEDERFARALARALGWPVP